MWFTENAWPPMLIAGLAALVCLALWNSDRNSKYLMAAIFCLVLIGGFYALEKAIVTEPERIQGDVAQLCDQFRMRQPQALEHFSDSVPELKTLCETAMNSVQIASDLTLSDFQTTMTNNRSVANVHFRANASITFSGMTARHPLRCILTYQREGGAWKIVKVERLDPISGKKVDIMAPR